MTMEIRGTRLIVAPDQVEHWLNGVQTAQYDVDVVFASPIMLQHHRRWVAGAGRP
jgi:hypothetical protein